MSERERVRESVREREIVRERCSDLQLFISPEREREGGDNGLFITLVLESFNITFSYS